MRNEQGLVQLNLQNDIQFAHSGNYQTPPQVMGDRKSTRLNSSHQIISYAVFCLKKKKRKTIITQSTGRNATSTTKDPNRRPGHLNRAYSSLFCRPTLNMLSILVVVRAPRTLSAH